ncbi:MAG TPA: DUF4252 domain-containing protein [Bacteroidales bacterium]|nr:DUF4252 domain-containing protein [Bacteroidales bacterium]
MIERFSGLLAGLLVISALSVQSCNREERNREIFEDYEGNEGIYMIKLPPSLFLGMINSGTGKDVDSNEIGNVDFVKVMVFDQSEAGGKTTGELFGEISNKFSSFGYEMIIRINSGGSDISAYILEKDPFVSDLMLIIREDKSLTGIGLSGRLDSKAILNFASEIDFDDLKGLMDNI